MILELNKPIWLSTPKGNGIAYFLIDYGPEMDLIWVVFLENGEIWSYSNPEVRTINNITMMRAMHPTQITTPFE